MPQAVTFGPPVISVDVEDWPQSTWDRDLPITERAVVNTRRILDLLRDAGVYGTMFVLGKFAEGFPKVVREIRGAGHEVACHGYGHVEIFKQSREEFAQEVYRSKDLLEQILGEPIRGYRAADFSIVRHTLWALEVLAEAGFTYDSSIFPVRLARYGIPDWPAAPVQVALPGHNGSIIEVPIATFRFLGKNWPVGGGGYHRLLPGWMSRHLAKRVMASAPFIYYCHPYESDALEFKEIPINIPLQIRLHQGLGRRWFRQRLKAFLHQFGGRRMEELLSSGEWPGLELNSFLGTESTPTRGRNVS
jgi:polysaccharide deacetylase family protein (PEP-CTERM system associated)